MKERLLQVETSLTLNIQDLHTQYEVWGGENDYFHQNVFPQERIAELEDQMESRAESRRGSQSELRGERRGGDLVLSVTDLQHNFNKVKSYEAEILEQTRK